ncbi:MmgE/PrpD family protein [Halomonas smyrnensis]|uniref:MmgE/PrpD family protein n=1 Tax=Halomonas smyrnensis TaxID=720605 RepID=UPI000379D0B2|nr:MmgE/PrpD family protein [Halomonas smyrnensis]
MSQSAFSERLSAWATAEVLDVGAQAYESARTSLIDTLACMYLGTSMPQPRAVVAALDASGDTGPSVPVGGGVGRTLTGAALVNGARAHALDFDDYELSGSSHASGPIFSALFSLASARGLSIHQVCEAWLVGHETVVQMGRALGYGHYDKGWHSTLTLGPIGVAAAAGRALSLSQAQMANAMALASSSAAGSLRQTGSHAKAIHEGLAAQAGLQAALMAQRGATANTVIWDIASGFASLYGTDSSPGFDAAIADAELGLGTERFPVIRKLWPSCAYTQRPIAGAEAVAAQLLDEEKITRVRYHMPRPFHQVARFDIPGNDAEARFSVPYCLAAGLLSGHVTPDDFEPAAFNDPARQALAAKVELELYELPPGHSGDIGPTSPEFLIVTLSSGRVLEREERAVPGGADLPMTETQLLQKVSDCGLSVDEAQSLLRADSAEALTRCALFTSTAPFTGHNAA